MLIVIYSSSLYLEQVLRQVSTFDAMSFVTIQKNEESVLKSIATISDDDGCYTVRVGGEILLLKKPAKINELAAMIISKLGDRFYNLEGGKFYPWKRSIVIGESKLWLTEKESAILYHLIERQPEFVHKKGLLKDVWCYNEDIETATVEAHMYRLKNKLASQKLGHIIVTEENSYALKCSD